MLRLHYNSALSQNVLLERACLGMVLDKKKKWKTIAHQYIGLYQEVWKIRICPSLHVHLACRRFQTLQMNKASLKNMDSYKKNANTLKKQWHFIFFKIIPVCMVWYGYRSIGPFLVSHQWPPHEASMSLQEDPSHQLCQSWTSPKIQ